MVIPSFGAFIAREVSAYYDGEKQRFVAPGRELSYNVLLTEDDGLLINYIANYKQLSYPEAKQFVKDQVTMAQKTLRDKGVLSVEGIGSLTRDAENHIEFKPIKKRLEQLNCYGFDASFTFTQITEKSISMTMEPDEKPEKKIVYRVAAGFIAAIIIAAVVFLFPDSKSKYVQTAGVSIQDQTEYIESSSDSTNIVTSDENQDLADNQVETEEKPEVKTTTVQKVEKETTRILEEEEKNFNNNPANYYHIIIGSTATNNLAQKVANNIILHDGVYASVLDCGERFRVVNKTFTNRSRAIAYCEAFRNENPKFNDAWVYVEKNR